MKNPAICYGVDPELMDDNTVEITGRYLIKGRECALYACGACSKVAFVPTEILDDPDLENRAGRFGEALQRGNFCDAAIHVAPYNEGNVSVTITPQA